MPMTEPVSPPADGAPPNLTREMAQEAFWREMFPDQGGIDYALGWARATPSFGWLTTTANDKPL